LQGIYFISLYYISVFFLFLWSAQHFFIHILYAFFREFLVRALVQKEEQNEQGTTKMAEEGGEVQRSGYKTEFVERIR